MITFPVSIGLGPNAGCYGTMRLRVDTALWEKRGEDDFTDYI